MEVLAAEEDEEEEDAELEEVAVFPLAASSRDFWVTPVALAICLS